MNKNVYSRVLHNSSRQYKPYIHQEINDKYKVVYTIVYTYTMEYNSATNYWYREQHKWGPRASSGSEWELASLPDLGEGFSAGKTWPSFAFCQGCGRAQRFWRGDLHVILKRERRNSLAFGVRQCQVQILALLLSPCIPVCGRCCFSEPQFLSLKGSPYCIGTTRGSNVIMLKPLSTTHCRDVH